LDSNKCGKDWVVVAALVPGQTNEQCCKRWTRRLDPTSKKKNASTGKWTVEEDAKLIDAVTTCGKDWVAVAALVPGRTKAQCCITWAVRLDPAIAKPTRPGKLTLEEEAKLIAAVAKRGKDWVAVAALVPGRTNSQCCATWTDRVDPTTSKGKKKITGRWTVEEIQKLVADAVKRCGKDWVAVAALVPGRRNSQCCSTWTFRVDPNVDRTHGGTGKWQQKEDAKLIDAVKKFGNDWVAVVTLVPGRTNEQCARRWSVVRLTATSEGKDSKTGKWTAKEDAKLTDAVKKCGKDWVAVAALVAGRTNAQCINRWEIVGLRTTCQGKKASAGKWTLEEDSKLIEAVTVCGKDWGKDWVAVAALVPGRTNKQCCKRWALRVGPNIDGMPTAEVAKQPIKTQS
jgi:hypothetical protein